MKCAFAVCLVAFGLIGCASSHVIVGTPRAAITPAEVRLYTTPPPNYEEIALLDASSQSSFAIGDQMKVDVVIRRLKEEAAALGANGILLQGVGSQSAGAVGTGTATANGNMAYGTGISGNIFMKTGRGVAIYVPPAP